MLIHYVFAVTRKGAPLFTEEKRRGGFIVSQQNPRQLRAECSSRASRREDTDCAFCPKLEVRARGAYALPRAQFSIFVLLHAHVKMRRFVRSGVGKVASLLAIRMNELYAEAYR